MDKCTTIRRDLRILAYYGGKAIDNSSLETLKQQRFAILSVLYNQKTLITADYIFALLGGIGFVYRFWQNSR